MDNCRISLSWIPTLKHWTLWKDTRLAAHFITYISLTRHVYSIYILTLFKEMSKKPILCYYICTTYAILAIFESSFKPDLLHSLIQNLVWIDPKSTDLTTDLIITIVYMSAAILSHLTYGGCFCERVYVLFHILICFFICFYFRFVILRLPRRLQLPYYSEIITTLYPVKGELIVFSPTIDMEGWTSASLITLCA